MARRDPFDLTPASKTRPTPFPFVLDELAPLDPVTRPMFGSLGVYVGERIVMILRDKGPGDADTGVWLAFDPEREAELAVVLPRLGQIEVFRNKVAGWKKLSARSAEFEDDVGVVCRLLLAGDERIGKVPNQKRPRAARKEPATASKKPSRSAAKASPRGEAKASPRATARAPSRRTATESPRDAVRGSPRAATKSSPSATKGRPSATKGRPSATKGSPSAARSARGRG